MANEVIGGKRGIDVLRDPETNRSAAFSEKEREALGLTGLLPSGVDTEEIQVRGWVEKPDDPRAFLESKLYRL